MSNLLTITARDIPEAWFLALREVITYGREYPVEKGSFEGLHLYSNAFSWAHLACGLESM